MHSFRRVASLACIAVILFTVSSLLAPLLTAQEGEPLLLRADSLRLALNFDAALSLYDQILAANPVSRGGLYGRGVIRINRNETEAGLADMRSALAVDSGCSRCYYWMARGVAVQGNQEEGLQYLGKAIALDSSSADFWTFRASLQSSRSAALDDLNRAVALAPNDPAMLSDRAAFYYNNKSLMMALQDLNSVLALDSTFAYGYFLRGRVYMDRNDLPRALQEMNKALRFGYNNVGLFWMRGGIHEGLGHIDSALADYTAALDLDPNRFEVLHSRAMMRYKKEDMDGSCRDLDKVLELIGDNKEARAIAIVAWDGWCDSSTMVYYSHRGIAQFNLGNYAQAIEWYDRGLRKFPESLTLRSFRGNAAAALGRYALTVQDYEYVLPRFERSFEEWWEMLGERRGALNKEEARLKSLSQAYSMLAFAKGQMKEFDAAFRLIDSAMAVEPNPEALYNQRGLLNLWKGDWSKAISDFETALSVAPGYPEALVNRASVYLLQATTSEKKTTTTLNIGLMSGGNRTSSASFPISTKTEKVDLDLVKMARADLDRAIAGNGLIGQAYEYRAFARKLLGEADYCEDIVKVRSLGFEPVLGMTPECR